MKQARQDLGLPNTKRIIAILPGSRLNEINKNTEPLLLAAKQAGEAYDNLHFVSGFVNDKTHERFNQIRKNIAPDLEIDMYVGKTHHVMESADIIVLASGTATLEAMLLQKPMVVVYRLSWLTYFIVKALAKIPYASLPNILAGKKIVPECLQADCHQEKIFSELKEIIDSDEKTNLMKQEFLKISMGLKKNADNSAAKAVLNLLKGKEFV